MKRSVVIVLVLLGGCARYSVKKEMSQLSDLSHKTLGHEVVLKSAQEIEQSVAEYQAFLEGGISRAQAVGSALLNNPSIQASFEELGIAKADLAQAGLYTNPHFDAIFRIPTKSGSLAIESDLNIAISDLWQVPHKKNVAKIDLKLTTLKVLKDMLELQTQVNMTYDRCLYLDAKLAVSTAMVAQTKKWHKQLKNRQLFGLEADDEVLFSHAQLMQRKLECEQIVASRDAAYLKLRKLMGIQISYRRPVLTSSLRDSLVGCPKIPQLVSIAQTYQPAYLMALLAIEHEKKHISLEQSRVIRRMDLGVSLERELDGAVSIGPSFGFEVPFFDGNGAQIRRRQVALEKAQKLSKAYKDAITHDVMVTCRQIKHLKKQDMLYVHQLLPVLKQAHEYAQRHTSTMQISLVKAFEHHLKVLEATSSHLDIMIELRDQHSLLARTLGVSLDMIENQ